MHCKLAGPATLVGLSVALSVALAADQPPLVGDFAEVDSEVANMLVYPADLAECSDDKATATAHLNGDVPRIIHQIWLGDPAIFDVALTQTWRDLAAQFGYQYHLWTEEDDDFLIDLIGRPTVDYLQFLRQKKRWEAASDVLRYHLVEALGGMYFDADVPAPTVDGKLVDPARVWPMKGLIMASESNTRETHNGAFYVVNAILMASPHHPVLQALTASLLPNRDNQPENMEKWHLGPIHLCGQTLLSATVRGQFTMLPLHYLENLGMFFWPDLIKYRQRLREEFAARPVRPTRMSSMHPAGDEWRMRR